MKLQSYEIGGWILDLFAGQKNFYPSLATLIDRGSKEIAFNYEVLAVELFARLLTKDGLKKVEKATPEGLWIRAIHSKLSKNLDFKMLCNPVYSDAETAGISTYEILRFLFDILPKPKEPMLDDPAPLRAAVLDMKERGLTGFDLESLMDDGKAIAAALRGYREAIDKIDRYQISDACRRAFEASDRRTGPIYAAGELFSISGGQTGDAKKKTEFYRAIQGSYKLKRIVDMAGRMTRRAIDAQITKEADGIFTPDGVGGVDDLSFSIPSEVFERGSFAEIAAAIDESSLPGYEMSEAPTGGGSLVIILDSTGSMDGSPEIWAKAVTWALVAIAQRQKRHCQIIHYGNGARRVDDFPAESLDTGRLAETMEYFFGDSVNNEPATFNKALEHIKTQPTLMDSKIVFITDGGWGEGGYDSAEWERTFAAELHDYSVMVFTILIACGKGDVPEFLRHPERTVMVGDIANDEEIDKIFAAL